jgi:hypothetical protein
MADYSPSKKATTDKYVAGAKNALRGGSRLAAERFSLFGTLAQYSQIIPKAYL